MNVRIITTFGGEGATLKIAGQLQLADLTVVDNEIRLVDGTLTLDLSELLSADPAGIERLREMAAGGAELRGASGYVQLLLDERRQ